MLLTCLALGLTMAKVRTERVTAPIAPTMAEPTMVEGWVMDVDSPGDRGHRVVVAPVRVQGLEPEATPIRLRVLPAFRRHGGVSGEALLPLVVGEAFAEELRHVPDGADNGLLARDCAHHRGHQYSQSAWYNGGIFKSSCFIKRLCFQGLPFGELHKCYDRVLHLIQSAVWKLNRRFGCRLRYLAIFPRYWSAIH
jgi:hypothetical protein